MPKPCSKTASRIPDSRSANFTTSAFAGNDTTTPPYLHVHISRTSLPGRPERIRDFATWSDVPSARLAFLATDARAASSGSVRASPRALCSRPPLPRHATLAIMNTHDLDRLVAYAATATDYDVADLGTFPDWFLAAFDARGADDLPPQAVFTAYLPAPAATIHVSPCPRPGDVQHESGERLWNIATAFALSCSFERLKRAGLLESYTIDDPFSLHGVGTCTFSEEDRRYYASAPLPEHLRQYVRGRRDRPTIHDRYPRTHRKDRRAATGGSASTENPRYGGGCAPLPPASFPAPGDLPGTGRTGAPPTTSTQLSGTKLADGHEALKGMPATSTR